MARPRSIHHVSGHKGGHEVDVGKEGPISLKVVFFLVKTSTFNCMNIWNSDLL